MPAPRHVTDDSQSKRIETQISGIQEKTEAKKMDVCFAERLHVRSLNADLLRSSSCRQRCNHKHKLAADHRSACLHCLAK